MKKHQIKGAIISNVAILLIALVFFVSSVYAWFEFVYKSETEHYIFIGSFKVDLRDNATGPDGFAQALNIDLKNMYPTTATVAQTNVANNHRYLFQIINLGNVYAMYRFIITSDDKSDPVPLSQQLKYSIRVGYSPGSGRWRYSDYVFDDLLDDDEKLNNLTLQQCLDSFTVRTDAMGETYGDYGEVRATTPGPIYYDICFWLGEKATLDTANEDAGSGIWQGKKATLTINAYFMQSTGGARWPDRWEEVLKPLTP